MDEFVLRTIWKVDSITYTAFS